MGFELEQAQHHGLGQVADLQFPYSIQHLTTTWVEGGKVHPVFSMHLDS